MDDPAAGRPPVASAPPPASLARRLAPRVNPKDVGYGLLIALGALFVYLIATAAHVRELTDPNAMDYAQIARHLARGEGFTTSFIRPLSLARVANTSHHPDLSYTPLHPLWMSLFFRLGGANYRMASLSCGVAYLLTLPLVYLLGARLFDRRGGLLALGLYGVNYLSLQYAVSGLEVSLATLATTILLVALYHYVSGEKPSLPLAAACGAALAMSVLVKEVLVVLALPVLLVVLLRKGEKRWTEAAVALAAFVVVMAPWGIRNARLTGNPFFTLRTAELLSDTSTYKGQSLYRAFVAPMPSPAQYLLSHPKELWLKVRPVALTMYDAIPNLGGPFVAAFWLAGVFMRFRNESLHALRLWHYAAVLLVTITLCLLSADARMLVPLSPLVTIVSAGACLALLDRWAESVQGPKQKRRVLSWGITGVLAVCWFPVVAMTAALQEQDVETTRNVAKICTGLKERKVGLVYCDQPWTAAWYGDLDAIWLPQTKEPEGEGEANPDDDLKSLEEAIGPVQYLLLTPAVGSAPEEEGLAMWARLYGAGRRGMPWPYRRFTLADALGANRDWLIYARMPEGAEGAQASPPGPAAP